mmetsp:Transcript_92492/g.297341  ORF Transcript_92492/g.297341 Transcript_92492/m.297341 type:complete len:90 (-) Transcript_92492:244-513(-)
MAPAGVQPRAHNDEVAKHPSWAAVDAEQRRSPNVRCPAGLAEAEAEAPVERPQAILLAPMAIPQPMPHAAPPMARTPPPQPHMQLGAWA